MQNVAGIEKLEMIEALFLQREKHLNNLNMKDFKLNVFEHGYICIWK